MTGTKVEFLPGYFLFYTNYGQKKLYQLLEIKSHKQFVQFLSASATNDIGIMNEDLEKMVLAGLVWDKKDITMEQVEELVEQYYLAGNNFQDLNEIVVEAFCESGLMDRKQVEIAKELKDISKEELKQRFLESLSTTQTGNKEADTQGEDKGE